MSKSCEALSQVMEELRSWPEAGKWGRMNGFEDQIRMGRDYIITSDLQIWR
jgi:hypothetical protein